MVKFKSNIFNLLLITVIIILLCILVYVIKTPVTYDVLYFDSWQGAFDTEYYKSAFPGSNLINVKLSPSNGINSVRLLSVHSLSRHNIPATFGSQIFS